MNRAAQPRSTNDEGFTLIELLMAMVMTGIVAGIVALAMMAALRSQNGVDARLTSSGALESLTRWYTEDAQSADPSRPPLGVPDTCPTTSENSGGTTLWSFVSVQQVSNTPTGTQNVGTPYVSEYRWIPFGSGPNAGIRFVRLRCHTDTTTSNGTTVTVIAENLPPGSTLAMQAPLETSNFVQYRIQGRFGDPSTTSVSVDVVGLARKSTLVTGNPLTGPCAVVSAISMGTMPSGGFYVNPADPADPSTTTAGVNGQLADAINVVVTTSGRCDRPLLIVQNVNGSTLRDTRGSPIVMSGGPSNWFVSLDPTDDARWPANTNTNNGGFGTNTYRLTASSNTTGTSTTISLGTVNFNTQVVPCRQITAVGMTKSGSGLDVAVGGAGQVGETVTFTTTTSMSCTAPQFNVRNSATNALTTGSPLNPVVGQLSGGTRVWSVVVNAASTARWPANADYTMTATANPGAVNLGQVSFHTSSPITCVVTAPLSVNKPDYSVDGPGATVGRLRENLVLRVTTASTCSAPVVSFTNAGGSAGSPVTLTESPPGSGLWSATLNAASTQRFPDGSDPFTASALTHDTALPTVDIVAGNAAFTTSTSATCTASIVMSKTYATGTPNQYVQVRNDTGHLGELRENLTFNLNTTGTCAATGANLVITRSGGVASTYSLGSAPYSISFGAGTRGTGGSNWSINSLPVGNAYQSTYIVTVTGLTDYVSNTAVTVPTMLNPYTGAANFVTNGSTPCTTSLVKTSPTGFVPITSAGVLRLPVVFTLTGTGTCGGATPQLSISDGSGDVTAPGAMTAAGAGTWTRTFAAGSTPGWGNGGANLNVLTTGFTDTVLGALNQTLPFTSYTADPCAATLAMTKDQATGPSALTVNVRSDNNQLRENVVFALNTTGTCAATAPHVIVTRTSGGPATQVSDQAMTGSGPFSYTFQINTDPGWGNGAGTFVPSTTGLTDSVTNTAVTVPPFVNGYTAVGNFTTTGSCVATVVKTTPAGAVQITSTSALRGAVVFTLSTTGTCSGTPTMGISNSGGTTVTPAAAMVNVGGGVYTRTFADNSVQNWGTGGATFTAVVNALTDPMSGPVSPQPTVNFTTVLSANCGATLTMSKTFNTAPLSNNVQVRSDVGFVGQLREAVTFTLNTTGSCSAAPNLVIGASTSPFAAGAVTFAAGTTPSWSGSTIPSTLTPSVTNLLDTITSTPVTVVFTNPYTTLNNFTTIGSTPCIATLALVTNPTTTPPGAYVPVNATGALRATTDFILTRNANCSGTPQLGVTDSSSTVINPAVNMTDLGTGLSWRRRFGNGFSPGWGNGGAAFNANVTGVIDTYTNTPATVAVLNFPVQGPCAASLTMSKTLNTAPASNNVQVRNDAGHLGELREGLTFTLTTTGSCSSSPTLTIGTTVTPFATGTVVFAPGSIPDPTFATIPGTFVPAVGNLVDAFDSTVPTVAFTNPYTPANPGNFTTAGSTPCSVVFAKTAPAGNVAVNGSRLNTTVTFTYTRTGGCSAATPLLTVQRTSPTAATVYTATAMGGADPSFSTSITGNGSGTAPNWGASGSVMSATASASTDSVTGATVTPAAIVFNTV